MKEGALDQIGFGLRKPGAGCRLAMGGGAGPPPMLIGCFRSAMNLAGNARTGLWDRDEPRYAVAVREMRRGATGSFRPSTANRGITSPS